MTVEPDSEVSLEIFDRNSFLLHEPISSHCGEEFSLVEEAFEKYGWIPKEYGQLGSQRFMEKYCWTN